MMTNDRSIKMEMLFGHTELYDKKLYDRMEHGDAESVRLHFLADRSYQERMIRFIENP